MTIWLTSDEHFNHANIIGYCHRPFSCIEEMNQTIIDRLNALVESGDEVYHLGDFAWDSGARFLGALKGRRHVLVLGNHDHKHLKSWDFDAFDSVVDVAKIKANHVSLWASHYAHAKWPASHRGRCHVFGHSHGLFDGIGRSLDVGVDARSFAPITFEEALEIANKKGDYYVPITGRSEDQEKTQRPVVDVAPIP